MLIYRTSLKLIVMFRPKKCRDGLIIRPEKCMFAGDPNMVSFTVTESFLLAGINQGGNHLVVGFIDGGEIEIVIGTIPICWIGLIWRISTVSPRTMRCRALDAVSLTQRSGPDPEKILYLCC